MTSKTKQATIEKIVREAHDDILDSLERILDHYADAINLLGGAQPKKRINWLIIGFTIQAINSVWAALSALTRGLYTQAYILVRSAFEDWTAVMYLAKKPEKADLWFREKPRIPSQKRMSEVIFGKETEAFKRERKLYGLLSELTHPRIRTLEEAFFSGPEGKRVPRVSGFHDEQDTLKALKLLVASALTLANPVGALLKGLSRKDTTDWEEKFATLNTELESWLQEEIAKTGPLV